MSELNAGHELDALIAEKVMGFAVKLWPHTDRLFVAERGNGTQILLPAYSTDIAAAWEVVEKLGERFHARLLTPFIRSGDNHYWCGFTPLGMTGFNGRPDYEAVAETAPLAICRAALKAVGV